MIYTYKRFYYWLGSALLISITLPPICSDESITSLNSTRQLIQNVGNDALREGMHALRKGKELKKGTTPVKLMKLAIEERPVNVTLRLISCLSRLLEKNGCKLKRSDKHEILKYAVMGNASFEVIEYLVKHGIFDGKHMKGGVRYDITLQLSLMRIIGPEVLTKQLLPESMNFALIRVSQICLFLRLIQWITGLLAIPEKYMWIGTIGVSIWPIELAINAMIVVYYSLYKIGIAPNYLMLTLLTHRPKAEKEKLAFLFLEHGADPNAKCFIAEYLSAKSQHPDIAMMYTMYTPARYRYMSTVQLAAKCNLLPLVKELLRQGVDQDTCAVYMEDKIDTTKSPPNPVLVTLSELYRRKSEEATYKLLLDFPGRKTKTYRYLTKKGFQHYPKEETA